MPGTVLDTGDTVKIVTVSVLKYFIVWWKRQANK